MDPRYPNSSDDLYSLQMELKQVQFSQSNISDRLLRLEKRQADDAAIKSVWNSPFPGVIGGTPQQGQQNASVSWEAASDGNGLDPAQLPHNDLFDDLDEQGEQLLGSLHLGPAEEEPVRRGAASRANSVRFDESALHGSSWGGGQNNRHSGDFGPVRPTSSLMMERTLSHKSDGRHSSAGHSVHSHHSVASGRASSLGLDTNFATGDEEDSSSFDIPGPPASFYVLGTVPSIVRCWLTTNFAHATLLYADLCTGSQKSTVDFSLIKDLELVDEVHRDVDGICRARLDVYFAEAVITQHGSRSSQTTGAVPSITVLFEVTGLEQGGSNVDRKAIRIFIGSDALRAHSADVLLSQNTVLLYGNERDRLRVPFVRPEDDAVFRHICTSNVIPEKPKLNANAAPFILGGNAQEAVEDSMPEDVPADLIVDQTGTAEAHEEDKKAVPRDIPATAREVEEPPRDMGDPDSGGKGGSVPSDTSRKESNPGIWGSWRSGSTSGQDGPAPQNGPLSGYQPAARGTRNMKILKPTKPATSSARTGASYEPPLPSKPLGENRRKGHAAGGGDSANGNHRWEGKRAVSSGAEMKASSSQPAGRENNRNAGTLPRSANPVGNPVGVASAFSWMAPPPPKGSKSSAAPTS